MLNLAERVRREWLGFRRDCRMDRFRCFRFNTTQLIGAGCLAELLEVIDAEGSARADVRKVRHRDEVSGQLRRLSYQPVAVGDSNPTTWSFVSRASTVKCATDPRAGTQQRCRKGNLTRSSPWNRLWISHHSRASNTQPFVANVIASRRCAMPVQTASATIGRQLPFIHQTRAGRMLSFPAKPFTRMDVFGRRRSSSSRCSVQRATSGAKRIADIVMTCMERQRKKI